MTRFIRLLVKSPKQSLEQRILALLRNPKYQPLDKSELARALRLSGRERVALRQTLRELERAGEIACNRKNRYFLPAMADLVTGTIQIQQAGYGFLTREQS